MPDSALPDIVAAFGHLLHAAGVPVTPEDIAHAVAFVASDEAHMIHGITLYVDGGINSTRLL